MTNRTQTLKWISTALFASAGLMLALKLPFSAYGFIMFLAGHVILGTIFYKIQDWPLVTQNVAFGIIDLVGIYRWFLS